MRHGTPANRLSRREWLRRTAATAGACAGYGLTDRLLPLFASPNPEPHPLAAPFSLDRFSTGYLIDEHGASGVAH